MAEKVSIHSNDFKSNAANNFSKLRTITDFMDVTLVGDDQKPLSAHKVILSSSSEYFKNILTQHDHSHPLICLDGFNYEDIENVLDFLYTGNLQIFREDLDRFMQISQKLKVEGLSYNNDQEGSEHRILEFETPLSRKFEEKIINNAYANFCFFSDKFANTEELDLTLKENVQKNVDGTQSTKCKICGKIYNKSSYATEHVEMTHIEGLQFQCNICQKVLKNRNAVRRHKNGYRCSPTQKNELSWY